MERYMCKMCGYIIKSDPLKVLPACPKCNSSYPFIKIKTETEKPKKELSVKC